jgi:hypothetical protein
MEARAASTRQFADEDQLNALGKVSNLESLTKRLVAI